MAEPSPAKGGGDGGGLESGEEEVLRRLTPAEEERRMGLSGQHTAIRGATDAKRYKAIGNSMVIQVMSWIGEGIQAVEGIRASMGETHAD